MNICWILFSEVLQKYISSPFIHFRVRQAAREAAALYRKRFEGSTGEPSHENKMGDPHLFLSYTKLKTETEEYLKHY